MIYFGIYALGRASMDSIEIANESNILSGRASNGEYNTGKAMINSIKSDSRQLKAVLKITCTASDMDLLINNFINLPNAQYDLVTLAPVNIFGYEKKISHSVKIFDIERESKSYLAGMGVYKVVIVGL